MTDVGDGGPEDRISCFMSIVQELCAEMPNARHVEMPEGGCMSAAEASRPFVAVLEDFAATM